MSEVAHSCCDEYARTGKQHAANCAYAVLGVDAPELVRVKADFARLAHQHAGAVDLIRELDEMLRPMPPFNPVRVKVREWIEAQA